MATDIEESDTDDHERSAPPKQQCTRLLNNEAIWDMEKSLKQEETRQETENVVYDDAEQQAREKLKRWQACQVAKGYMNNIINIVLENYMYSNSMGSRSLLFGGDDMEDTAVKMAILNHGLSAGIVSQSTGCYSEKAPGYGTNKNVRCASSSNGVQGSFESVATTSSGFKLNDARSMEECTRLDWDLDKIDENDQQENILERAVAEAIKKKGLSALSVD